LCDDFETGNDSRWNSGIEPPKPEISLAVDTVRPHAGSYSLHAKVLLGALTGSYNRTCEETLSSLSPPFAVRFWFYNVNLLDNFTLIGEFRQPNDDSISFGGGNGAWAVTETTAGGTTDHLAATAVPTGQWMCVEVVDDGTQVHLYTDNIERVVFSPAVLGPFSAFTLGLPRWPAKRDNELFFDDVILARSRVGCP
jgi:hypothetical protein